MAIDPLAAASVNRPDTQRPDGTGAGEAIAPSGGHHHRHHGGVAPTDQVELSATSTAATPDGDVPAGTLDAARLRQITERLTSGEYDTPAAADRIAGKLIAGGEI